MADPVRVCLKDVREHLVLCNKTFAKRIKYVRPKAWVNVAAFPSDFVLAQLSQAVYHDSPKLPDGWVLLTTARNKKDGYFGAAVWNPQDRHVVVAHRGTNDWRAVIADVVGIVWNQVTSQVHSACSFAAVVMEVARAKKVRVSFTGHSLGGWHAQLTTFSTEYLIVDENGFSAHKTESGKCHTVVFDSPGAWEMIKKLSEGYYPRYDDQHNAHSKVDALDITTYMLEPNMVNTCGPQVGTLVFLDARPLDQDPGPKPTTPGWGLVQLYQKVWSFLRRVIARPVPEVEKVVLKLEKVVLDSNITSHSIDGFVKSLNPPSPLEEAPPVYEIIDWPVYYFVESNTYKVISLKLLKYNIGLQIIDLFVNMLSNDSYSDEYRDYRKQLTDANRGNPVELYREGDDCKRGINIHVSVVEIEEGVSRTNVFSCSELTFLIQLRMWRHDKEEPGTSKEDKVDLKIIEGYLRENRVQPAEILEMEFRIEENKIKCDSKEKLQDVISRTTQLFLRCSEIHAKMKEQTSRFPKIHDALYRKTSKQYAKPYCLQEGQTVSFGSNYLGLGTFLESTEERVLHLTSSQTTGLNPARLCYNVLHGANKPLYKLGEHCTFLSWTDLQQIDESVDVAAKFGNIKSTIDRLLIVDCSEENKLITNGVELFKKLLLQLNDVQEEERLKKIIVITNDKVQSRRIRRLFQDEKVRRKEVAMRPPKWSDLTKDSQKELLERKVVTFQGRDTLTSLSALVTGPGDESHPSWDSIIDPETIFQIINGEKIRIGEKPLSMSDLEAAYSRPNETLSMEHLLNALDSSEHLFMMSGIETLGSDQKELIVELKQDGKLFETGLDEENSLGQFKKLCREHPSQTIHWVKVEAQNQCAQWLMLYHGTFYFKRNIDKVVLQNEKIKELLLKEQTNTFIFSGVDSEDDLKNIFAISTGEYNAFSSKVKKGSIKFGSSNENVDASDKTHWLKVERENNEPKIVWTRSKGSVDILRNAINKTKSTVLPFNEDDFPTIQNRVVIVADETGMGKSTTLTSLSDQLPESSWVVRVDLGNCQEAISKLPLSCSFDDAVTFVNEIYNTSSSSPLTRSLLKYALNNTTQVFLLFDAFDEIKEADRENTSNRKIINLLKCLREETQATIWITTRDYKRETLENSLSVFSFSFESIKEKEQQLFLKDFWQVRRSLKTNPDTRAEEDNIIDKFATTLLKEAKNMLGFRICRFIGVPLQMRLLAESFQEEVESSIFSKDLSNIKLQNLNVLYKKFITAKYNIYFKEKISLSIDSAKDLQFITNIVTEKLTKKHRTLAFSHLCPGELIKFARSQSLNSDEIKDYKTELLRIGLIQSTPGQNQLQFIHLSFSEYFTADSLMYWIHKSGEGGSHHEKQPHLVDFLLKQIFLKSKFKVVRIFLNYMLEDNEVSFSRDDREYPRDGQKRTALHIVAIENQVNIAKYLLRDHVGVIDKIDKEGNTALEHRATLDACCNNGRTPLHWAAKEGHEDVVKVFLKKKAEVNKQDKDGDTPLLLAALEGHTATVMTLLKHEANFDARCNKGSMPLHWAARGGHEDVVKVLLDKGAKVNTQDVDGWTPLHLAALEGHTDTVLTLLKHEATVDALSYDGHTPLHWAAMRGHEDVVELLLEEGADVNTQAKDGDTPLQLATNSARTHIAQILQQHGAKRFFRRNYNINNSQ